LRRQIYSAGYIDTHVTSFNRLICSRGRTAPISTAFARTKTKSRGSNRISTTMFARYIRSGITSVVDVGGPMWNLEVRKKANATAKAPRVAVAGPLISSVSREKLDLGDPPIVKIDTPDQAREFVRKLAEQKTGSGEDLVHRGQRSSRRCVSAYRPRDD
jgi:hypothetical protein